jgi:hypothetical protein
MFLAAAAALGVRPGQCAMFEGAIAGVQAGRAGAFAWVVGVDRVGQAEALRSHGADRVAADLVELLAPCHPRPGAGARAGAAPGRRELPVADDPRRGVLWVLAGRHGRLPRQR